MSLYEETSLKYTWSNSYYINTSKIVQQDIAKLILYLKIWQFVESPPAIYGSRLMGAQFPGIVTDFTFVSV